MSADRPDFIDPTATEYSHGGLHILPNEEFTSNVTPIEPYLPASSQPERGYHKPSGDAWVTVSKTGLELGDHEIYTDRRNNVHTANVLYSEPYDFKESTVTGNVTGYFFQYTQGYSGDEYGVIHPHTAPHKELRKHVETNDHGQEIVYWREEDHPRRLAWTGNETKRVLTVTYNSQTGEVTHGYIKGKDLRYALEDKARLERARAELKKINDAQHTAHNQTSEEGVANEHVLIEEYEEYSLSAG
jgi:hypothetical protein